MKKDGGTADIKPYPGWSGLFGLSGLFYDGKMRHILKEEGYKDKERNAGLRVLNAALVILLNKSYLYMLDCSDRNSGSEYNG